MSELRYGLICPDCSPIGDGRLCPLHPVGEPWRCWRCHRLDCDIVEIEFCLGRRLYAFVEVEVHTIPDDIALDAESHQVADATADDLADFVRAQGGLL